MKNFIGLNIKYLCDENKLSQNEFGDLFGLKQNVVSSYTREKANPQIETLQKICEHFGISLDDLVNKNLRTLRFEEIWNDSDVVEELSALQGNQHLYMQKTIETQEKMIELLQEEIKRLKGETAYKSKTA